MLLQITQLMLQEYWGTAPDIWILGIWLISATDIRYLPVRSHRYLDIKPTRQSALYQKHSVPFCSNLSRSVCLGLFQADLPVLSGCGWDHAEMWLRPRVSNKWFVGRNINFATIIENCTLISDSPISAVYSWLVVRIAILCRRLDTSKCFVYYCLLSFWSAFLLNPLTPFRTLSGTQLWSVAKAKGKQWVWVLIR